MSDVGGTSAAVRAAADAVSAAAEELVDAAGLVKDGSVAGAHTVAVLRVVERWSWDLAAGRIGTLDLSRRLGALQYASIGQFALAVNRIGGGLAAALDAEVTPERDADRMAALDELTAVIAETGATPTLHAMPTDPDAIRQLAAMLRLRAPGAASGEGHPNSIEPRESDTARGCAATVFERVREVTPAAASLIAIDALVVDCAPSVSMLVYEGAARWRERWARRRRNTAEGQSPVLARADGLVNTAAELAGRVAALGAGAAPQERAALDQVVERARWHRDRVRMDL